MFGSSLPPVMCKKAHILFTLLCLLAYSGVQHILCCVFLRIVRHVLPVSLDCPSLIVPSVFSNIYLQNDEGILKIINVRQMRGNQQDIGRRQTN